MKTLKIVVILMLVFTHSVNAQEIINLYNGTIPNSKGNYMPIVKKEGV